MNRNPLRDVPAWLVSMVFHLIVLMTLAVLTSPAMGPSSATQLIAAAADQPGSSHANPGASLSGAARPPTCDIQARSLCPRGLNRPAATGAGAPRQTSRRPRFVVSARPFNTFL